MSDDYDGLPTAVELVIAQVGEARMPEPLRPQQQLALLPEREPESAPDRRPSDPQAAKGPGRPPGARNKRTEELVDYLLSRYEHPLEWLAKRYTKPVAELARELSCDRFEAGKLQQGAAVALLPYVAQKQPMAVQVDSKGQVTIIIQEGEGPAEGGDEGEDSVVMDLDYEEVGNGGKSST